MFLLLIRPPRRSPFGPPSEVIAAKPKLGPANDIYSFAILAYEIFCRGMPLPTGRVVDRPFLGENQGEIPFMIAVNQAVVKAKNGSRPFIPDTVPRKFQDVLRACWDHGRYCELFLGVFEALTLP